MLVPTSDSGHIPRRTISLKGRFPGHETRDIAGCKIDNSICDLCIQFIQCCMSSKNTNNHNNRLSWVKCGPGAPNPANDSVTLVFEHYSSFQMLDSSARAGCGFCVAMLHSVPIGPDNRIVLSLGQQRYRHDMKEFGKYEQDWTTFSMFPVRELLQGYGALPEVRFEFMMAKSTIDCLNVPSGQAKHPLRYPLTNPNSDECFDMIENWRKTCTKKHDRCTRSDRPLPTRLLDLWPNGKDKSSIRLVESRHFSRFSKKPRYVALSYCWGKQHGLKLEKKNLAQMLQGIAVDGLPKVMRDAVKVCRATDIRYLWIDALCICQDDKADWAKEGVKMADYYSGCDFTISALASPDTTVGFLHDRNAIPIFLGQTKVPHGSRPEMSNLFVRKIPRTVTEEMKLSPLNERAWPLQERILSPALLHFGRDQLIWECNTDYLVSETGEVSRSSDVVLRPDKSGLVPVRTH